MGERDGSGYWATWIGSGIGFVAGGAVGGWIGAATVPPNAELEGILNFVIGMALGAWLGSVLGLWVALKVAGRRFAGTTATLFFLFLPLAVGLFALVIAMTNNGDGLVAFGSLGTGILLIGYAARKLALKSEPGDG
jgi:hypothetical protein